MVLKIYTETLYPGMLPCLFDISPQTVATIQLTLIFFIPIWSVRPLIANPFFCLEAAIFYIAKILDAELYQ